ncbi:DNA primase [Dermacoccaceae bacterium W4C1]
MAGRIRAEDIAAVKERSSLEDVVREHVTLRHAGPGSLKGLCPFHDEKTPSFTIRPAVGAYHCFGCGEGGDVIEFVMKTEHLSFAESVERLAAKLGMELRYEDGERPQTESIGKRSRLIEAHRVAQEFYAVALRGQDARAARDFLRGKGFDGGAADRFGVGYAPRGMDVLTAHLRDKGFTAEELVTAGLSGRSSRGSLYDRFRGRVVWPIRDITGDTVGFGARRLYDDDRVEAKYLNTSETPIYKKATVLYGLDLAKRDISKERRAVVVEGYTDVMACHLAGVTQAVATCGTAFGVDHIKTLRRLLRDETDQDAARVIFTFDGDAAGQKAAMKAFEQDQRWASQSFVAVADAGQDPCDLRINAGDQAVVDLVDEAVPMFEFAARTVVKRFDLAHAEGRVRAIRAVAPIILGVRDQTMQRAYTAQVAGWIGVDPEEVRRAVTAAARRAKNEPNGPSAGSGGPTNSHEPAQEGGEPSLPMPDLRDPVVALERQLLQTVVQYPRLLTQEQWDALEPQSFSAPAHRAIMEGIQVVGAERMNLSGAAWNQMLAQQSAQVVHPLLNELAVAAIPAPTDESGRPAAKYVEALVLRLREVSLSRRISDAMSTLRRESEHPDTARAAAVELQRLQHELARVKDRLA